MTHEQFVELAAASHRAVVRAFGVSLFLCAASIGASYTGHWLASLVIAIVSIAPARLAFVRMRRARAVMNAYHAQLVREAVAIHNATREPPPPGVTRQ